MNQAVQLAQPPLATVALTHGIVAIVDDDPDISRALGMWLDLQNVCAIHHVSGESLLKSIHQEDGHLVLHKEGRNPTTFPLVGAVLDLNLPGMNGFELASRLRQLVPELPIVIITALREHERSRYGSPPSGIKCLKKPFDLVALEDALFPLLH